MREKLVNARLDKKISQNEFSKILGISRGFYSLIELGLRNPDYGLAKKISKELNISVEELFLNLDSFRVKREAI